MELTLSAILIIYFIIVAFFLIFTIINLYHVFKFGFIDLPTFWATFIFLAFTAINLFIVIYYAQTIDWSASLFSFDVFSQQLDPRFYSF